MTNTLGSGSVTTATKASKKTIIIAIIVAVVCAVGAFFGFAISGFLVTGFDATNAHYERGDLLMQLIVLTLTGVLVAAGPIAMAIGTKSAKWRSLAIALVVATPVFGILYYWLNYWR